MVNKLKYKILDLIAILMGDTLENIVGVKISKDIEVELKTYLDKNTARAMQIGGSDRAFGYVDGFLDAISESKKFITGVTTQNKKLV